MRRAIAATMRIAIREMIHSGLIMEGLYPVANSTNHRVRLMRLVRWEAVRVSALWAEGEKRL
jgi:hypothetical protein